MDAWAEAEKILGYPGAMISGSKTPRQGHVVVWNANVCTREHGKIWFGDLDLTMASEGVEQLARNLGATVYVLREMDARFENEAKPLFDQAVFRTDT